MQWVARDSKGLLIRQYDEKGEHYQAELIGKWIISVGYWDENKDEYYLCSLVTGTFYFPGKTIETDKDIGGRKFVLKREHSITRDRHGIRYVFGFEKNGKKWEADTDGKEVREV